MKRKDKNNMNRFVDQNVFTELFIFILVVIAYQVFKPLAAVLFVVWAIMYVINRESDYEE